MTTRELLIVAAVAALISLWILDLVRRERLYPGYGIVLILTIGGATVLAVIPAVRAAATEILGAGDPGTTLILLALLFITSLIAYVLSQITIVSNRLTTLVQELAIREASRRGDDA